ncbi:MAG: DUF2742 domain-containing protein [Solirubrobacterales bacterium]|nr:DUF2742 domain-containing protein [Solirubrobacterales bacterium]
MSCCSPSSVSCFKCDLARLRKLSVCFWATALCDSSRRISSSRSWAARSRSSWAKSSVLRAASARGWTKTM